MQLTRRHITVSVIAPGTDGVLAWCPLAPNMEVTKVHMDFTITGTSAINVLQAAAYGLSAYSFPIPDPDNVGETPNQLWDAVVPKSESLVSLVGSADDALQFAPVAGPGGDPSTGAAVNADGSPTAQRRDSDNDNTEPKTPDVSVGTAIDLVELIGGYKPKRWYKDRGLVTHLSPGSFYSDADNFRPAVKLRIDMDMRQRARLPAMMMLGFSAPTFAGDFKSFSKTTLGDATDDNSGTPLQQQWSPSNIRDWGALMRPQAWLDYWIEDALGGRDVDMGTDSTASQIDRVLSFVQQIHDPGVAETGLQDSTWLAVGESVYQVTVPQPGEPQLSPD